MAGKGPENIYREEMGKAAYLHRALSGIKKVKLYTPEPRAPWYVPVLSFNVGDIPSEEAGAYLAKRGIAVRCGLRCARFAHKKFGAEESGTVRASVSVFTRRQELDALAMAVSKI